MTTKFLSFALILIVLSSCATRKTITSKSAEINGPTIIQKPVIADLDVEEKKVSGVVVGKVKTPINQLKQLAIADALKKADADVLVEPRFEIDFEKTKTTVTVTGFPAKYENFRPMEEKDTIFVNSTVLQASGKNGTTNTSGQKRKTLPIVLGSIGGAVGIFFLTIFLLY